MRTFYYKLNKCFYVDFRQKLTLFTENRTENERILDKFCLVWKVANQISIGHSTYSSPVRIVSKNNAAPFSGSSTNMWVTAPANFPS